MIPRIALQFPLPGQTIKALPFDLPSTPRPLAIVTLKNRTLSPLTRTFIDEASKAPDALAIEFRQQRYHGHCLLLARPGPADRSISPLRAEADALRSI